jgi:uncharacterized membrane protein YidH (DUF202 family)
VADAADGLQPERTALAWNRTALAMIVVGALYVRAGSGWLHAVGRIPGWLLMGLGVSLLIAVVVRYRRLSSWAGDRDVLVARWVPRLLAWATVAFSIASLGLIVASG